MCASGSSFWAAGQLGWVEILETAGGLYDPSIGDGSRRDWYSRNTGQLYICHFKKQGSAAGRPYDFMIKGDMRKFGIWYTRPNIRISMIFLSKIVSQVRARSNVITHDVITFCFNQREHLLPDIREKHKVRLARVVYRAPCGHTGDSRRPFWSGGACGLSFWSFGSGGSFGSDRSFGSGRSF